MLWKERNARTFKDEAAEAQDLCLAILQEATLVAGRLLVLVVAHLAHVVGHFSGFSRPLYCFFSALSLVFVLASAARLGQTSVYPFRT